MTGNVLLVEDEPSVGELVRAYLERDGYRVIWVRSGEDALVELDRHPLRMVILDIGLPGIDGFTVCREMRARSQVPILMLTARGEAEDRIAGLEVGADDYLPKPFEPRELLLRVGALLRRAAPPARSAHAEVRMGDAVYDPERGQLRRKGKPVHLTSSEAALLQLFAANAGRSFSRSDLCTRLGVTLERSIDVQVTRLRRKIEEDPKLPLYLQTVRGVGYVLVPDRVT
jgi:two-component system phosphate regulon response regulator OmpR